MLPSCRRPLVVLLSLVSRALFMRNELGAAVSCDYAVDVAAFPEDASAKLATPLTSESTVDAPQAIKDRVDVIGSLVQSQPNNSEKPSQPKSEQAAGDLEETWSLFSDKWYPSQVNSNEATSSPTVQSPAIMRPETHRIDGTATTSPGDAANLAEDQDDSAPDDDAFQDAIDFPLDQAREDDNFQDAIGPTMTEMGQGGASGQGVAAGHTYDSSEFPTLDEAIDSARRNKKKGDKTNTAECALPTGDDAEQIKNGMTEACTSKTEEEFGKQLTEELGKQLGAAVRKMAIDATSHSVASDARRDACSKTCTCIVEQMWANQEVGTAKPLDAGAKSAHDDLADEAFAAGDLEEDTVPAAVPNGDKTAITTPASGPELTAQAEKPAQDDLAPEEEPTDVADSGSTPGADQTKKKKEKKKVPEDTSKQDKRQSTFAVLSGAMVVAAVLGGLVYKFSDDWFPDEV